MKVTRVCLKDVQGILYIFTNDKRVFINGSYRGRGVLITPVPDLGISRRAYFILEKEKLHTDPLIGCYVT